MGMQTVRDFLIKVWSEERKHYKHLIIDGKFDTDLIATLTGE